MLRVTPLYGSYGHHPSSASLSIPPSSTLVEYGGVRVLVNVGWDESLPLPDYASVTAASGGDVNPSSGASMDVDSAVPPEFLPDVDAIVLTDSTLSSLGGLPMYLGRRARAARLARLRAAAAGQAEGEGVELPPLPPIYGTYPTLKMGQMTLYDYHATQCLDGRNPGFDLSDIDELFAENVHFIPLKYSQTLSLPLDPNATSRKAGVVAAQVSAATSVKPLLGVTPHRAGHVTGGAFYVLRRLSDETEVVVAPGNAYQPAKERHLDGATLHKFGGAADVLITGPGGSGGLLGRLYRPPTGGGRPILTSTTVSRKEGELVELVMAALRRGGNVLLPVDASGRVMELLLLLSRHWERQRLGSAYNLCWVGSMSWNTIEFGRSQLEWMAAPLGAQFDSQRGHPYALKTVNICSTLAELDVIVEASNGNPTVALASGASLDSGPARDLLLRWSENPDNAVILTDSTRCVCRGDVEAAKALGLPAPGQKAAATLASASSTISAGETAADAEEEVGESEAALVGSAILPGEVSSLSTAAQLLTKWCEAKAEREEMADVIDVDVPVPHRYPLAGHELQAFLVEEERARKRKLAEKERQAMLREVEQAKESLRLGEDDTGAVVASSASEKSGDAAARLTGTKAKAGTLASRPKKKSRFDQTLFLKFSKPLHMTFEVRDEQVGIGQGDIVATAFGIANTTGKSANVIEDDYGIAVEPERFVDIVTGIDPSKGSARIGENIRGLGFGSDGRPLISSGGGGPGAGEDGRLTESGETIDDEQALEAADLSECKGIIRGRKGRPPIKVSTLPRKVEVLAEVAYVPLEGSVDARAARQSIRALQPRQVVILGGGVPRSPAALREKVMGNTIGEIELIGDAIKSLSAGKESLPMFIPADSETVELSVGHAAYSVRLIDAPYRTQEEKEAAAAVGEEAEDLALPEPFEAKMGEYTVSLVENVATGQKVAADGSIVLAPSAALINERRHRPSVMISDGDVLLTDLRAELIAQGMKADYSTRAGYAQLIVNGKVIVRKDQVTGKLDVEGPLCQDFFSIRSIVCGQFVTL